MRNEEERDRTQAQLRGGGTPEQQNDPSGQHNSKVDRRHVLKGAGMFLGASGAFAALATPAAGNGTDEDAEEIAGLWQGLVSAQDNSFPPFKTFEIYGGRIWLGSGQPDLTPAALSSTLWAVFKRVGHHKFRGIGRFWTYDPNANPTGFGAVDQTTTVSEDGKTYHGEGSLQFFDNNGNPLGPPTTIIDNGNRIAFL